MCDSTIIMGAAVGYTADALRPFVASCHSAMPTARIVLFSDKADAINAPGVELVKILDSDYRHFLRSFPRGGRFLSRCSHAFGSVLSPDKGPSSPLFTAAFGIAIARFFWYRDWLKQQTLNGNENILLADTRDVVFQKDVFSGRTENRLFCGVEPVKIRNCGINKGWLETAYRHELPQSLLDQNVLCSGVVGGPLVLMRQYIDQMCCELGRIGTRILRASGYDQAVHNFLLRTTDIGTHFEYDTWDSDRLCTMHFVSTTQLQRDAQGNLCDTRGQIISILHQYDRRQELVEWAEQRWGGHIVAP